MTTTQQKRTAAKPSDIHDPLKIWLGRLRQRAHLFVNRQTWTLKPNWQAPIHNDGFAVTRPSGFSRQGTLLYRETTCPLTMTDEILRVL